MWGVSKGIQGEADARVAATVEGFKTEVIANTYRALEKIFNDSDPSKYMTMPELAGFFSDLARRIEK